ncbi:MAG TPA: hypothetical protein VNK25_01135 [Candidatus Nitrosotenuis sp.]|nr:hypothetical protein [Candidatus Nitrosotenuis sp.]
MAKQAIWIGITIGVFFAGLGIGYAAFQATSTTNFLHMNPQQMQNMMNDPNFRQQMMTQWRQNPQTMNDWMNQMMADPQLIGQMHDIMMNDPKHMQQMHQMMQNNPQHMQQMTQMMGPGMAGMMMNDPQLRQQMIDSMIQHEELMQELVTNQQFQQNWMGPMGGQGMMGNQGMMGGPMMMGTPITKQADVLKTVDKIEDLLDQVSSKYRSGDTSGALSLATTAYLENYEYIEGVIADKDSALMQKVELMLRQDLRHAINTQQPAEDIDTQINSIKAELQKIRSLFQ